MRKFLRSFSISPLGVVWIWALVVGGVLWLSYTAPGEPPKIFLDSFGAFEDSERDGHVPSGKEYIEVTDSCGTAYEGACVRTRSGPGIEYPVVDQLRTGVVLKVDGSVLSGMRLWYKVVFDEAVRYPERLKGPQYVAADYVRHFYDDGVVLRGHPTSPKSIVVNRSTQKLYAYDGMDLFMEATISSGLEITPTPRGTFTIYKKTPSRYMQGPLPGISDQYYDLPGVPWNLYFSQQGAVIHGAYWHDKFGRTWSHGCVNVPLPDARKLYEWADVGTHVLVRD